MTKPASERTLWEYVLLAISGFATLAQLLGLISQSQILFAQPFVTTTFVLIVLAGTAIGCLFVLLRKKPGTFGPKEVPYYTERLRLFAVITLVANAFVSTSVLAVILLRPCLSSVESIPVGKFGILVADFTEGLNRNPSSKGNELVDR